MSEVMSRDTDSAPSRVLILKLTADGDKFVNELSAAGYAVHGISPHEFCFSNRELLLRAILSPESYSGLILTSQRAVEAIENCFTSKDDLQEWKQNALLQWQLLPVFVVGKATEETAQKTGFKTIGSDAGNAKALVLIIKEWFGLSVSEKPLLFLCADIRKDTLPEELKASGIPLQEIIAYCTRPNPELEAKLQSLVKLNGSPQFIVFFSPSSVKFSLSFLTSILPEWPAIKLVAIGPSTAEELKNAGCPVSATARKPTPEEIVRAIQLCSETS